MKPVQANNITGFLPFIASVDWANDIWIYGLLAFHLMCFTNIIMFRHSHLFQTFIFLLLLITVYAAEYINEWAAKNYKLFSTEQYFDSNGLFFSVFYSFPALFNSCLCLVFWLYDSGMLMFRTKRDQIQRSLQKQQQRSPAESNGTNKRDRLRRRAKIDDDDDGAAGDTNNIEQNARNSNSKKSD